MIAYLVCSSLHLHHASVYAMHPSTPLHFFINLMLCCFHDNNLLACHALRNLSSCVTNVFILCASFYTRLACSLFFALSSHILHCISITYLCIHVLCHVVYALVMHLASCIFLRKLVHVISMHLAHSHLHFVSCI